LINVTFKSDKVHDPHFSCSSRSLFLVRRRISGIYFSIFAARFENAAWMRDWRYRWSSYL